MGWHDGAIYVQSMPVMEDDQRPAADAASALLNAAISDRLWQKAKAHADKSAVAVDLEVVAKVAKEQRGIALPVSKRAETQEQYLASVPHVHNRIPEGATWDGSEELLVTAEEFEAVRAGKPLPKRAKAASAKGTSTEKSQSSAVATSGGSAKAGSR
jgi:hypothetical protein